MKAALASFVAAAILDFAGAHKFHTNNWAALQKLDYQSLIDNFHSENTSHLSYDGTGLKIHAIHIWSEPDGSPIANASLSGWKATPTRKVVQERAPQPYACVTPVACEPSGNGFRFLSQQQELFIAQKLCPFVGTSIQAGAGAVIGMISTNMLCARAQPCSSFISISGAIAWANTIGARTAGPITDVCNETLMAIVSWCGDRGGSTQCIAHSVNPGYVPDASELASVAIEPQSLNPPCPSGDECTTIDCNNGNGNCQAVTGAGGI